MSSVQALSSLLQALPSFKGKRRLGRAIMKITGVSTHHDVVVNTKAGTFHLPNLKEMISMDLFMNGYYERGLVRMLKEQMPANGVLIDIGANIGSISIPLSRMRPDIRIVAVEASPWIFRVLKANIEANNATNITAANFAVYSESQRSLPMYAPKELFGKGSLKAVYTNDAEMVESITVDDIKRKFNLPAIHFIKVDVEGFEAAVFQGMTQLTINDKPKIVFEFSEWAEVAAGFKAREAQSIILSKGYRIQQMDNDFNLVGEPSYELQKIKSANLFAS
jgi:FkbM family methyltransferase